MRPPLLPLLRPKSQTARSILAVTQASLPVSLGYLVTLYVTRQEATQPLLVTGVVVCFRCLTAKVNSGGGGN